MVPPNCTWRREGLPYLPYTGSPTTSSPGCDVEIIIILMLMMMMMMMIFLTNSHHRHDHDRHVILVQCRRGSTLRKDKGG